VTPPDHDGGPVLARLLALMGVGGGISTAADTVLHHIPAGVLGALVTLAGAALLEVLRPILRAYGERAARKMARESIPPPAPESKQ